MVAASHFGAADPFIQTNGLGSPMGTRPIPPQRGQLGSGTPETSWPIPRLAANPVAREPARNERRGTVRWSVVIGQLSLVKNDPLLSSAKLQMFFGKLLRIKGVRRSDPLVLVGSQVRSCECVTSSFIVRLRAREVNRLSA